MPQCGALTRKGPQQIVSSVSRSNTTESLADRFLVPKIGSVVVAPRDHSCVRPFYVTA